MGHPSDPETVLRLTCERMMAGDPRRGSPSAGADVGAVGRALVAVGMLDEAAVMAVVDEYGLALGIRIGPLTHFMRTFAGERENLSAQRVAAGDFKVDTADRHMVITKIVFSDDDTRLYARWSFTGGNPAAGRGPRWGAAQMHTGPPHPGALSLSDDRGTTASATPQGWGGSDISWQGTFHSDRPLSADTAWIEVDGTRMVLAAPGPAPSVRVEPVKGTNALRDGLRQEILSGLQGQSALEEFISALVSLGAVAEDDPDVAEARVVTTALQHGSAPPGVRSPPWDAVFRRTSASDGPVGHMPVGAAIESVAGHSVRFDALTSGPDSFSVEVAVSPGGPLLHHFPGFQLDPLPITWWAEDDRDNLYLGIANSAGGSSSLAEGAIAFTAPLDPHATELRLVPTGRTERAVVSFLLDRLGSEP